MPKKLLSTLFFTAIIVSTFVFVLSVHAAARQSDVDHDGIPDAVDPATIINTNVTLSAGAYTFKNLIITENSVLTLNSGSSPDGFKGVYITADNIIVQEGSSLYINGVGYVTGQDLAAGVISIDTVNGRQEVKLSVGSDYSGQSVIDYPEQIRGVPEGCFAVAPEDLSSCEICILMDDDAEFITRLIGFGLSEKEAQLYLHLLKYGPKPTSLLTKTLKTYREDVYRTLTGLIDKGMVNPSLESPTVYAAVELSIALAASIKKHETELREMKMRKQELQEILQQQRFWPSDKSATYKIYKNVRDIMAVSITTVNSLEEEFLGCVSGIAAVVAVLFGINEAAKKLIDRGGKVRIITDISYPMIELAQQLLDIGEDVHHYDQYRGIMFEVWDRKTCISAINADIKRFSLDEPVTAFWSDDPTYANYLVSTFELLWEQSVPAAQRIEELLKEGPPQV